MSKPFLIADIGGTNARFGLAETDRSADGVHIMERKDYKASEFASLEDALADYLATLGERGLDEACFAVAGPIHDRVVDFTNSSWTLDGNALSKRLSLDEMQVVNDFKAMTYGSLFVPPADLVEIKPGEADLSRPRAVLGPGTGLGLGLIVPSGKELLALATEGGHVTYSPTNDRQVALMRQLEKTFDHVSFERIVSGKGMLNTYRALCEIDDADCALKTPEEVTIAAIEHNDSRAEETLCLFCESLGTYAGNIVLSTGALGGVYLAGGILPKIREFFLESRFVEAFLKKQPMEDYVGAVPVKLITTKDTALIGAAKLLKDAQA